VAAQRLHVLDILVERIFGGVAAGGTALAAMVEIDELHPLGQWGQDRLEAAVIAARPAMDDEGDRALAHAWTVGHQAGAIDVEIDLGVSDLGPHGWLHRTLVGDRSLAHPHAAGPVKLPRVFFVDFRYSMPP
jgi:hypothetical protein